LFDLMITDEAHHYPAATWVRLATKLRDAAPAHHILNELLLTATPHHHVAGNLDDDQVRDAPQLTPFNLLDGLVDNIVKGVVCLEIQTRERIDRRRIELSPQLQVLILIGDILRTKMGGHPSIMHRALVVVKDIDAAIDLEQAYNSIPVANKPMVCGVRMRVARYHGSSPAHAPVPEGTLNNFSLPNQPHPIHCLIQVQKLNEGYDQPSISVVGVCTPIRSANKFAQFVGRGVRRLGAHNLDPALVPHKVDGRDNMTHVITHSHFCQMGNWHDFTSQQGQGVFNLNAVDSSDEDPDDEPEIAPEGPESDDAQEPLAHRARSIPVVVRRAMAPTIQHRQQMLASEAHIHDGACNAWAFEDENL